MAAIADGSPLREIRFIVRERALSRPLAKWFLLHSRSLPMTAAIEAQAVRLALLFASFHHARSHLGLISPNQSLALFSMHFWVEGGMLELFAKNFGAPVYRASLSTASYFNRFEG